MLKILLKTFAIIGMFFFCQQISSQQMLNGIILDENGEAIPGVNIRIKGTDRGTITDFEGKYSISVYMGDDLIISFVGMRTQEVKITEESFLMLSCDGENLRNVARRETPVRIPQYYDNPTFRNEQNNKPQGKADGVAYLKDKENRSFNLIKSNGSHGENVLTKIKYNKINDNYVFSFEKPYKFRTEHFEFNSGFSFDKVFHLPKFQDNYSSGIPQNGQFVYLNSDEGNLFSWGPKIATLEYDGNNSFFYKGGNIVGAGFGNGKKLTTYSPNDFFKTGLRFNNSIEYKFFKNDFSCTAKYIYRQNYGVMPGSKHNGHDVNFGVKYRNINIKSYLTFTTGVKNMNESNYSRIIHSSFITPPEFDNSFGHTSKDAISNTSAFLTQGNDQRSFSKNSLENPFWLAFLDPSKNSIKRYGIRSSYKKEFGYEWNTFFSAAFQKELSKKTSGFVSFYSPNDGWLYEKSDDNLDFKASARLDKKFRINRYRLYNFINYIYKYEQYDFKREDYNLAFILPEQLNSGENHSIFNQLNKRAVHELSARVSNVQAYNNKPFSFSTGLNIYNSSTSNSFYFLPILHLGFHFEELNNRVSSFIPFTLSLSWSKSLKEADFQNRPNHFNTVNYTSAGFRDYKEDKNVKYDTGLKPSISDNFNAGFSMWNIANTSLGISADYFIKSSQDVFFPSQDDENILIKNMATIKNEGIEATISYKIRRFDFLLGFSKSRSRVETITNNLNCIQIAGFTDVQKQLIKGEEAGLIVGSRYLRNESNQLIIGDDGYPLVAPDLGIIANPNPDWVINFTHKFKWRKLGFTIDLEYKHGGQVWNGTKNVLNYHGVSEQAATSRDIINYVFEGVNQNGTPNIVAVDFANPNNSFEQFRYIRYGYSGVAEDAVEDASWFAIKRIGLSYEFTDFRSSWLNLSDLKLSAWVENALVVTPYSGVDPQSFLFGYNETAGLDLFNAPGTRRFGFNLCVSF